MSIPRAVLTAILITSAPARAPLKLVVDTTQTGSADTHFILPLDGSSAYNFTIDWGDANVQTITTNTPIDHTYSVSGTYTLKITENVVGGFPTLRFASGGDCLKLMQLTQWGTNKWLSFNYAFSGCENLHILATDSATANTGSAADFHAAWYNCHGMTSFPLLNTAAATNFNQTWFHCSGLTSFPALNAALVANFSQAWYNCTGLTSFPLLDTSSATSLYDAWGGCTALASFPALNTPLVADFSYAWAGCTGLNGYDFPTLNMGAMTNGAQCFNGVTLSTASYSALLVSIDALNARTHVTFSGGLSEYDAGAVTARGDLTATKLWTVTDGGLAP